MNAIRWRSATTRWRSCLMPPTAGWTPTALCRAPKTSPRHSRSAVFQLIVVPALGPGTTREEAARSIRSEHELAVGFEVRSGPHIELPVLADEKQRALGHFLGALQQHTRVVGAHFVGKR